MALAHVLRPASEERVVLLRGGPARGEALREGPLKVRQFLGEDEAHQCVAEPLELLKRRALAEAILQMPDNTPGLDGVRKGDLLALSPPCLRQLADLLNAIEGGAAWPKPTLVARAAFLSKGEDDLSHQG